MFEAVHGVARRYTGRDRANPLALLRCGAMLLRELGERLAAHALDDAIARVAARAASLTLDTASMHRPPTTAVVNAVISELESSSNHV